MLGSSPLRVLLLAVVTIAVSTNATQQRQTLAPHEVNASDAPPPIIWSTPELPSHPIDFESAEERKLRVVVVTKGLAGGDDGAITLGRGTWDGSRLVDVHDIFESGATETEASRLVFGGDGMIYMSVSAPGSPTVQRSQDPDDYAGKVVRLRDDGSVPGDNPFVNRAGFKPAIFTIGHRNGHGLAVNPETGDIWESEQGPSGGDELNVLHAGRNYGWPLVSYGRDYWGAQLAPHPSIEGFADPSVVWLPSIGLAGMTFYTGDRFPHWKRNVLVAGLRQGGIPRTGQIQRIVFNDEWEELRREPMLMELQQRIRDVREGPDGLLYVLTAEEDGALLRIEPR